MAPVLAPSQASVSQQQSTDVSKLEQEVSDATSQLHDVYAGFGIILAIGFGASAFSWFTTTRRESRLAIAGETASQARADALYNEFSSQLTQARETLDLVNQTLSLAETASRRAASAIEQRATETRHELDTEAHLLLDEVRHREDRALVADPELRDRLMTLAERIAGFENSQFFLPVEIGLTPRCRFIAGMAAHVKGQYNEALSRWEAAAIASDSDVELQSASRYWIGYEHNNLGRFERAYGSFQLALDAIRAAPGASIARTYDIRRIMIETLFFQDRPEGPLMTQLEQLLNELQAEPQSQEIQETTGRVAATLGNVCHIAAGKATNRPVATELYRKAASLFEPYASISDWARFGLAEALYQIPERREQAVSLYRDRLRTDAQREFDRRGEARSKFRARLLELIVCIRVPEFAREIDTLAISVRESLAVLEERLTVYSLLDRKNVPKSKMRDEELPRLLEAEVRPNA